MKNWIGLILLLLSFTLNAQTITTVAGTGYGPESGDGGPATAAGITNPAGGEFDRLGNYYFADATNSQRIRKINTAGIITTIAGNGGSGFTGDNVSATTTELNNPCMVRVDTSGNLYIADATNHRIRKVDTSGIITTIVGTGAGTYGGDGSPATAAQIFDPQDICFDKFGNLYIADLFNYRIRKVEATGIITTIAGNGTPGYTGDGVTADTTQIGLILGICTDTAGNVYIADNTHYRVRKIDINGIITTVAGNGISGTYIGDGIAATEAQIIPGRILVDRFNNLYITDKTNQRVYKVDASGILYNIAGTGVAGDTGDGGDATAATLNYPLAVAMDACGDLYIPTIGSSTPGSGRRIRKVTYPPILTVPIITLSSVIGAYPGTTVTVNATVSNAGSSYNIEWYNHGVQFATTTVPSVTYTKTNTTDTITARVVSTATYGCYDSTLSAQQIVLVAEGVGSVANGSSYSVYPNPVGDVLHVDGILQNGQAYKIISVVGEVLQKGILNKGANSISVKGLPAGVYMLEMVSGDGEKSVNRVIKQ